ncbi:MalY/PatB family protein [Mycetocola zhujimingii]|uniref:cysteine-S-conjugate beta-lyase n=1 Tax=Mycetocola zhujimingii TaxID=2079792 RepID=A0A2U1TGA8_9MICO|nr:aminotransferase class I/II-fold pyridoxal phosphate-dependent enzyme [Mycetocola zhujimingii]PWC07925.1 aspartate aminotransferase [Mycetocola zhujimingii]
MERVQADPLDVLRTRTSEKWTEYPSDVLPMFVAEMDYPLADPIRRALHSAIDRGDTGYVSSSNPVFAPFRQFARRRWSWDIEDATLLSTADVSMGIVEVLRAVCQPGDRVVVNDPVYAPFYDLVTEAGASVVRVPLATVERSHNSAHGSAHRLDLDAIEAAFADGVRAFLLCNPHNPLGLVHERADLEAVARLAARYSVTVVSDEIHAPLTQPSATFTPYLSVSPEARATGFAVHSASKAWNLAGLKCAIVVAHDTATAGVLESLPIEVSWRTGQFGVLASVAAYTDGEPWLDGVLGALSFNFDLLDALLGEHLPGVTWRRPRASYLAWLDFRAVGWGDDPAERVLTEARVALSSGVEFGDAGRGHARMNLACSPEVLTDAIVRIARIAHPRPN